MISRNVPVHRRWTRNLTECLRRMRLKMVLMISLSTNTVTDWNGFTSAILYHDPPEVSFLLHSLLHTSHRFFLTQMHKWTSGINNYSQRRLSHRKCFKASHTQTTYTHHVHLGQFDSTPACPPLHPTYRTSTWLPQIAQILQLCRQSKWARI